MKKEGNGRKVSKAVLVRLFDLLVGKYTKMIFCTYKIFSSGGFGFSADHIFKQFFGSSSFGEDGISTRDFFDTILDKTNRNTCIYTYILYLL